MATASVGYSVSVGGISFNKTVNRTIDHPNPYEVALPAGKAGTLTTRTDNDTGTATLGAGHGIITGDIVDIYWDGGVRYGVTVGTVAGTSVPFDLGAGDNLPIATSAIVMTKQVVINTQIDGDAIAIIGIVLESTESTGKGHVDMRDASPATIEEIDLTANIPVVHDITAGATNVFTGAVITNTKASNGSATAAATLKILSAEDSTV